MSSVMISSCRDLRRRGNVRGVYDGIGACQEKKSLSFRIRNAPGRPRASACGARGQALGARAGKCLLRLHFRRPRHLPATFQDWKSTARPVPENGILVGCNPLSCPGPALEWVDNPLDPPDGIWVETHSRSLRVPYGLPSVELTLAVENRWRIGKHGIEAVGLLLHPDDPLPLGGAR